MEATAVEQTTPDTEAAYTELMKTTVGTEEYYQAIVAFLSLLFPEGSPPIRQQVRRSIPGQGTVK